MGRLGAEKCTFSKKVREVRFVRKSSSQTSVKSLRGIIRQKVKIFWNFRKIKKLQKVTFAFLHTCTRKSGVWRAPNRKSAPWATFRTLARPNRPSRTFWYAYNVFARSGSSKITFCTFGLSGAVRRCPVLPGAGQWGLGRWPWLRPLVLGKRGKPRAGKSGNDVEF